MTGGCPKGRRIRPEAWPASEHLARHLQALRALPGNRLEALSGDRAGQLSVRINEQWRICFE
jgi:hypothetical protein